MSFLPFIYYVGTNIVSLKSHSISPAGDYIPRGIAGEILQKLTNYSVKLAIIGNFDKYKSKS